MNRKSAIRLLLLLLPIAVGAWVFIGHDQPVQVEAGNVQIKLKAPAYSPDAIAAVLDDEAGISAYFQTASPINLNEVRPLYRTIEIETSDYILGSMPVPDNWPEYDVHVYTHESGWMLTYYLRDEPAVKLFDWQTYAGTMNPTRFQAVVNYVAIILSLPSPTLTYYDFRYPNATNVLLAVEDVQVAATESFEILDTTFTYYERSWGLGGRYGGYDIAFYRVDDTEIFRRTARDATLYDTGFLSATELPSFEPHTIYVGQSSGSGFIKGALAIVYGP